MKMKWMLTALSLVAALALLPQAAGAAEEGESGRALYEKNCSRCHGVEGTGTDKGPPLVHRVYHPNHHGDASFHIAVRTGVRAHHWRFGDMPRIEGVTGGQTDQIIKYIRGLQKKAGIF